MRTRALKPKRISVPLLPEEIGELQEIAGATDRSLSWVAARAIRSYLAEARTASVALAPPGPTHERKLAK